MSRPPPAAVVFDIGNVLIEWNPARMYDAAIGPEERRRLFAEIDLEGMNAALDRGAPFLETVLETAARHPARAAQIRLWHDRWIEMASPAIDGSVALLGALRRAGVPVLALSNFGVECLALAERHYPFLRDFDRRYISGHLRMMKPEPAIYAHLETDSGYPPDSLLFIDDRPENIAAAEERGWRGHRFDGVAGLARRLAAEGLPQVTEGAAQ